ncbi:MAG: AlkA N-terminal domain-containing protein [Pseudomonadales bacterium]
MLPEPEICERARLSRDPRFDGRFIVGVLTTGIYCRPVCPARIPAEDNVRYFQTPAAAQEAGFRPCLRCRPETARRLPEWTLTSQTVIRGLRLIDAGFLDDRDLDALARELALSTRHLNRLFNAELGASPKSLAKVRRVQLAKRLIDHSPLPFADVALRAGYRSVRRFNDEIRTTYGRAPRILRARTLRGRPPGRKTGAARSPAQDEAADGLAAGDQLLQLTLPVREPYHADWVFDFLRQRGLPGLEEVEGHTYRRRLVATEGAGECPGWLQVSWVAGALHLAVPAEAVTDLGALLQRVRRLFDLDADPHALEAVLGADRQLRTAVAADPGLRVPGAWDGFETAVRAVLGQQVSVARATALATQMCERFGAGGFPDPAALAEADVVSLGMPGRRAAAIQTLARAVLDGDLILDESVDPLQLRERLCAIPGIGPWTAGYVGMRVARDPDAFPDNDWVVLKVLEKTAAGARTLAEAWRPWRAYAVMYLWRTEQLRRNR